MDSLTFESYQLASAETAIYPGSGTGDTSAIVYTLLGLTNEAGEVAGKYKKVMRDNGGFLTDEKRQEMLAEAGDVLWYLAGLVGELGAGLEDVAQANLDKLNSRKVRGVIGGSGDNR